MNFIEALEEMDKQIQTKPLRAYMHLSVDMGDGVFIEYICRRNPRWFIDLLFFKNDKEISRIPASIFNRNDWEVLIKGESE